MLEVWPCGVSRLEKTLLTRVIQSGQDGYTDAPEQIEASAGSVKIYLPARSVTLLHHKDQRGQN